MHWQFRYPKRNTFYPPDYETQGLGGSEASLVVLTRALAQRGHTVEVFNCCYKPGEYDGVRWRMIWERDDAKTPDVAVAVRFEEALWPDWSHAGAHLFWMLDDHGRSATAFADRFADRHGVVVTASQAMMRRLENTSAARIATQIPLPIEVGRYSEASSSRDPICLFTSMPNRGLDIALTIWPRIRSAVPDAQLHVTSGWQLRGFTIAEAEDIWHKTIGRISLPEGARILGVLPRDELIRVQQSGWLNLYPCCYAEMFCVSAAESAAAGTPMVASALEALTERVRDGETGTLIDGHINDPVTQDRFVDAAVSLLTDPVMRQRFALAGRRHVAECEPDRVAQEWETIATATLSLRHLEVAGEGAGVTVDQGACAGRGRQSAQ